MKSKLQCYERENQTLKDENASKKNIIETILNQNNELIKLNNSICYRNQTGIDKDTTIKPSEPPKQNEQTIGILQKKLVRVTHLFLLIDLEIYFMMHQ